MDVLSLVLQLILATSASWARMFIALFLSAALSIIVGIWMATSETAEKLLLPILDIFQTLPILAFFPFAIYVFVFILPGYIGVNTAVIFLIITSMLWNMIFGVYESVKTMPREYLELADLYKLNYFQRARLIFIPGSMNKLVEQSILSWSIGLFYLVTSEIFSVGNSNYSVTYGIGVQLVKLSSGPTSYYLAAIAVFILFVVLTRFLFFRPWENYASRYMRLDRRPAPRLSQYEHALENWFSSMRRGRSKKAATAKPRYSLVGARKAIKSAGARMKPLDQRRAYAVAAIVLAIAIGYAVLTSPWLIGDEAEVIYSLAFSFTRVWLAFLLIVVVSLPLCVYLVFISRKVSKYITLFQIISSIPATVLLPLIAQQLQGYPMQGELVAFIIFFLSGLWYIIFGMLSNGATLPGTVFEVRSVFGVKGINAWRNIYVKALIPGFITGALTGIAAEWNASIVAEYFTYSGIGSSTTATITSVNAGIGRLLDGALASNNIVLMVVAIINMVAMILLINTFVWKRFYKEVSKIYR
ncbi:MAG: ABC transporter permease subunit [Candidatus Micrarchaeota archaeon]|nr:ABC transporter permease subunit [Candidatus Micrarchaeota archaeon]